MTVDYTIPEAIRRYGELMRYWGKLREEKRFFEVAGSVYAEFSEAGDILDSIKTYRERTREFPQILEAVDPDLNELEKLCLELQKR